MNRRRWGDRAVLTMLLVVVVVLGTAASCHPRPAAQSSPSPSAVTSAGTTTAVTSAVRAPRTTASGARANRLGGVEKAIAARIKGGQSRWGDLDLRDVRSFGIEPLWDKGIDGAGTSVAVIEAWDVPGIQTVLDRLDDEIGLPHTQVRTVYPAGRLPATCPVGMQRLGDYGSCAAWAGELTLDVEAVHLFAPYARIVISATPADTEGPDDRSSQVAPPEMMKAVEYLTTRHLADVISISDGSSESDYAHGPAEIRAQDPGELTAAARGVPVVNATGDCGAAQNLASATGFCNRLTRGRAVGTWCDSPWVTAVGGVTTDYANRESGGPNSFSVWNVGLGGAEGAGFSAVYGRPAYQNAVASITHSRQRSMPDITMNGADGTSQATPQFAAVLALATQLHRGLLGAINGVLYDDLGRHPAASGLVDVTRGSNTYADVPGFFAGPGFDVATGWGTVDAARFVPALAAAVSRLPSPAPLTALAARELRTAQHQVTATPDVAAREQPIHVKATGFLPGHPVTVTTGEGKVLRSVRADRAGRVDLMLRPRDAHLAAGPHTLLLRGMLITETVHIRIT